MPVWNLAELVAMRMAKQLLVSGNLLALQQASRALARRGASPANRGCAAAPAALGKRCFATSVPLTAAILCPSWGQLL